MTPDRTRVTTAFTGDPRFGMAAPVAGTTTVRTPSGLTLNATTTRTTTLAYDAQGYLASVTDPLLRTVSFTNDGVGRATTQTFPDARVAGFTYDGVSNLTGLTPPGQPAHTLDYTAVHDLDTYTPPAVAGTGPTTYAYNADRQPTQVTRADGQTVGFGYDPAGPLDTLVTPTGTTTYGYEPGTGRLAGIAAPGATLTYAYDGALLLGEAWSGLVTGDVTWTYDPFFRVTSERVRGANQASRLLKKPAT